MASDLFLAGFEKCCTTTLHEILSNHDEIQSSTEKELTFFESDHYKPSLESYLDSCFPFISGKKYRLNARPYNSIIDYVIPRIDQVAENPKFLFSIREPIERSFSGWSNWNSMRPGRSIGNYSDALFDNISEYNPINERFKLESDWVPFSDRKYGTYKNIIIENGEYYRNIKKFINFFGIGNVNIFLSNNINEKSKIDLIFEWLNLETYDFEIKKLNKSLSQSRATYEIMIKYPDVYSALRKIYYYDTKMLSDIIEVDLFKLWYGE